MAFILMAEKHFTPLTELPGASDLAEYLPHSQPQLIGVHLGRLGALAFLGGFHREVRLTGFSGETSQTDYSIVGVNQDGTAVGGGRAVKNARLAEHDMQPTNNGLAEDGRQRTELTIRINTEALRERTDGIIRNPAKIAPHIDAALRMQLRQAAWKHLVKSPPHMGEGLGYLLAAPACYYLSQLIPNQNPGLVSIAANIMFSNIARTIRSSEELGQESLLSLVPFWYIDRAIAVSALTRMFPLVKNI